MRPLRTPLIILVLTILTLTIPVIAESSNVEVTVLKSTTFTSEEHYMLDLSAKKLLPYNSSQVQVLSYELKDLSSSDSYVPVVVLSIDKPSRIGDQVVSYAWVLRNAFGSSIVIGVADINATDNSVSNLRFIKISPAQGDIAILRTSIDLVIYYNNFKLSIPITNYTNPRLLIFTDSDVAVGNLYYIQLRSLANPPSGFTLIRSGRGEATFRYMVYFGPNCYDARMYVWFDESHDVGDVDLFVFDQNDPSFWIVDNADWYDLTQLCNQSLGTCLWLRADYGPEQGSLDVHMWVKFLVRKVPTWPHGDPRWRIAIRLVPLCTPHGETSTSTTTVTDTSRTTTRSPATTTTTTTTTLSPEPMEARGLFARIANTLSSGSSALAIVIVALGALAIAAALLRRR